MQDAKNRHLHTIAQLCLATSSQLRHVSTIRKKIVKQQYLPHMSSQYGELRLTSGWDPLASLGNPCKFQRVLRLGSVTTRQSSSGRQPNFAALNTGRHLYLAGRPSRWAAFLVCYNCSLRLHRIAWKFQEFSTFREFPEYSRFAGFSRLVATHFKNEWHVWWCELHQPHLINIATLPCERQNTENVMPEWEIINQNCIKCITVLSKWTTDIICLKFTYLGVIQQCMFEMIQDMHCCITPSYTDASSHLATIDMGRKLGAVPLF